MTTSAQTIQTNNEALIDAISLVEDNGYVKILYTACRTYIPLLIWNEKNYRIIPPGTLNMF